MQQFVAYKATTDQFDSYGDASSVQNVLSFCNHFKQVIKIWLKPFFLFDPHRLVIGSKCATIYCRSHEHTVTMSINMCLLCKTYSIIVVYFCISILKPHSYHSGSSDCCSILCSISSDFCLIFLRLVYCTI